MANPLSHLLKRLRFWLFEETDDIHVENPKRRRQLNNAYLIQAWAALTGIIVMALIPLVVWLISVQNFVIIYLILSAIAGTFYLTISWYVRRLNRQHDLN